MATKQTTMRLPQGRLKRETVNGAIFRHLLLEDCREDLSAFGMNVVSVSLQRIWDTSNYIANLANKTLSRKASGGGDRGVAFASTSRARRIRFKTSNAGR